MKIIERATGPRFDPCQNRLPVVRFYNEKQRSTPWKCIVAATEVAPGVFQIERIIDLCSLVYPLSEPFIDDTGFEWVVLVSHVEHLGLVVQRHDRKVVALNARPAFSFERSDEVQAGFPRLWSETEQKFMDQEVFS